MIFRTLDQEYSKKPNQLRKMTNHSRQEKQKPVYVTSQVVDYLKISCFYKNKTTSFNAGEFIYTCQQKSSLETK